MRRQIIAVATAGTVAMLGLTATAQAQSASQQSRARATASAAALRGSPARMRGPRMYDPLTGKLFPDASTATVSQTTQLTDQMVHVSWTNFTPSTALIYNNENVAYPVMVTECKGTHPTSPADCYGAENGGVTSTSGAFGPMNDAYATTGPNGTGQADIEILTKTENNFLGCDSTHPCSLAVVPAQGGNYSKTPPDCADHSQDFSFGTGYAVGAEAFGMLHFSCSWAKRIVFPLSFARTAADCPAHSTFSAAGSPMLARAMESWITALCAGPHGTTIHYDGVTAEPQALADLGTGQTDVALTTRTASAQGISTGPKHYVYAPVAVSAMSVAYWFDNAETGLPVTNIRLNQRLLLKLLTTSYAFDNDGCPPASQGVPCDKGVDHNPLNLFVDPEFLKLNPEYASQNGQPPRVTPPPSAAFEVPTVLLGLSDTTWTVTRWIAANRDARSFLHGQFDPYGMHLDTYYLGTKYPANTFVPKDPFPFIAHLYNPVFPSSLVAFDQVQNWPPYFSDVKNPVTGNYDRLPPQTPGGRSLIAITGQGDAAAFLFPVTRISNATGRFVGPTNAGMAAAVRTMVPAGSGTLQVNLHSSNPAVYPLTMVIYAVAPTSGTSHAKAAAIAKFIDYAAGAGQVRGPSPGQLPGGFLPLTAKLRAQARKAAQEVLNQTGATKP